MTRSMLALTTFDSATFALVSHQCLGYPKAPGQTCRLKDRAGQASKSVLETGYTSIARSDMTRLFKSRGMQVNQRLTMRDSSNFNIKRRSSRGIILGTWHGGPLRYLHIPRPSEERFREKRQDGEKAIRAFVISGRKCRLVRMREPPEATPVTNEDDAVFSRDLSSNDVLDEPSSRPHRNVRSHSPSEPLSTTRANHYSQRVSRSSTMDDASTLRGDGAEHVDAGSQTRSPSTKPEKSAANEGTVFQEGSNSRVHKSTQTDILIVPQQFVSTPSPTKNGEFLLPIPANGESGSKLSHHTRGSGSDAGSGSARRSHRNSSGSHGESNDSSSHRRRKHRPDFGDSAVEESYRKDESLASKLGFGGLKR